MLQSMRGNSKGPIVSGLLPKAATIGEVGLGSVLRVRFHAVPRQYQTDRYRPNKGLCNGASPCIGPHFANYPVAVLFRFLDARCIQYHANSLLWPIPHREVSATLEPVQRRSRESLDRAIRLLR